MPHKMNTRSCERVNGLAVVLRGQLSMVGELAGDQWNEGDVSCSVVRRVALPDAFFATDGLFQTFLTVLDEFGVFPAVVQRELDRYLPFLTTTKVLMAAVRNGVGPRGGARGDQGARRRRRPRDAAGHGRERPASSGSPPTPGWALDRAQIEALVADPVEFTGAARDQVATVVRRVEAVLATDPGGRGVRARRHPLTARAAPPCCLESGVSGGCDVGHRSPRFGCARFRHGEVSRALRTER